MRKFVVLFCLIVTGVYGTMVKAQAPKAGKASVKEIVGAMTLEEKANLVVGTGMRMPGMPPGGGPGGPGGWYPVQPVLRKVLVTLLLLPPLLLPVRL